MRLLLCSMMLIGAACDRRAAAPPPPPPLPGLPATGPSAAGTTGPAAPAAARPVHDDGDEALPAGHPPVGGAAQQPSGGMPAPSGGMPAGHPPVGDTAQAGGTMPAGHPPAGEPKGAIDPSQRITGTIELSPALKDKVKPGDAIFLSVRQDQGGAPGPLVAVDKLTAGAWPLKFDIDGSKAMSGGSSFVGKVFVVVRVDKDGDAMTKQPGDVTGQVAVTIPAKAAVVKLDKVL